MRAKRRKEVCEEGPVGRWTHGEGLVSLMRGVNPDSLAAANANSLYFYLMESRRPAGNGPKGKLCSQLWASARCSS